MGRKKKLTEYNTVTIEVPEWAVRMIEGMSYGRVPFERTDDLILYSAVVTMLALQHLPQRDTLEDINLSQNKLTNLVLETIKVLERYDDKGARIDDVRTITNAIGVSDDELGKIIKRLHRSGHVYSPQKDRLKIVK